MPVPDLRFRCVGTGLSLRLGVRLITGSIGGDGSAFGTQRAGAFGPLLMRIGDPEQVWPKDADAGARYVSGGWEAYAFETQPPIEPLFAEIRGGTTRRLDGDTEALLDARALITSFDFATASGAYASYGMTSVRRVDGAPLYDAATVVTIDRAQSFWTRCSNKVLPDGEATPVVCSALTNRSNATSETVSCAEPVRPSSFSSSAPSRTQGTSLPRRVHTTYAVPPSSKRSGGVRLVARRSSCVTFLSVLTSATSLPSEPGESCVPRKSYFNAPPQADNNMASTSGRALTVMQRNITEARARGQRLV